MGKKINIKYAYCDECKKEIEKPKRKPLDELEKSVWTVIILSTLGFAIIPFLIYLKYIRKRNTCPDCLNTLRISEKPFEKPKQLTDQTKEEDNKKKEKEREEEEEEIEEKVYCPFCGKSLSGPLAVCPYCETVLEEPRRNEIE